MAKCVLVILALEGLLQEGEGRGMAIHPPAGGRGVAALQRLLRECLAAPPGEGSWQGGLQLLPGQTETLEVLAGCVKYRWPVVHPCLPAVTAVRQPNQEAVESHNDSRYKYTPPHT